MPSSYRLISADSHLQVPADVWTDRVPARYRELAPRRVKLPDGGEAIVASNGSMYFGATGNYAGHTPEDFDPINAFDWDHAIGSGPPAQRLQEQDQDGVDAELLFPGSSATHGTRLKDAAAHQAMLRAYNSYLAGYCAEAPDRLWGVGIIPDGDVDSKIAELHQLKKEGIKAALLHGYPSGQPYPTLEDDRFWAAALDLQMPLCAHTTLSRGGGKLLEYPKTPDSGNLEDDFINRLYRHANAGRCGSLTACQMLFAGVWERFPGLTIYFAENNIGWIPFYFEQMDIEYQKNHVWAERHFGLKPLDRLPSDCIKEHVLWGFFDDPIGLKLRHEIGVDSIVWGSDFPHVVTHWPHSRRMLDREMDGMPDEERRKIEAENILRFLGLNGTARS